ncbi:YokU family protein [Ectobacillus sp. JY-23]|uniref:YokU family protein n=1 Tax=Ectobacillus sp. JY-23 TaxID=2933872 RepID=UPI001FF22ED3|nr:YokU family protein [Ectobacillus sp. JY-23]UOY94419.1 YokU family protein [Ectobacillus sp. JY-23]
MTCEWCGSTHVKESSNTVFWELPDGTKTIGIIDTPCICCAECGMEYQTTEIVKNIEDQLFLINTKQLEKSLAYEELMAKPRLLKRNYFDFTQG